MDLIPAHLKDDALLEDIHAASEDDSTFHLWWLGQSGFLVKWKTHFLLLDPYLSDSLTNKYRGTDKPHVRMSELFIDPARLDFLEVATSSHNHTDHLDGVTLLPLAAANPDMPLLLPEANLDFAQERLGSSAPELIGINDGETKPLGAFTFTGIPAAHNEVTRDNQGRCHFLGFVVQFGSFSLYHSGDTLWHRDLVRSIAPFQPDVALVPINGYRKERRVAGNLNGLEAAAVARGIGAGIAIPHHYHMFTFNTEEPDEFRWACERLQQPYALLRGGERWSL